MGFDCRASVGHGVHSWLLPSDLSGPKDQLPLEAQEDPGAQGSREHQQCQEHPVHVTEERGIRRGCEGGPTHLKEPSPKAATLTADPLAPGIPSVPGLP